MRLRGKVAIVTGAAQGIGRGIALRLAKEGCDLILVDLKEDPLIQVGREVEKTGRRTLIRRADVSQRDEVVATLGSAIEEMGRIDVLVNNAGIYTSAPLSDVTEDDWNLTIAVNLSGVFFCCQAVAKYLIKANQGAIINISSVGAKIPWERNHAYCASKAGVIALTKVLALDLAPRHITVNAICPGNTASPMMDAVDANICATEGLEPGTFKRQKVKEIPLGRYAEPSDIAGLVSFLASGDAAFITGQAINVDGGLVLC